MCALVFSYCRACAIYKELKVLPLLEVSLSIFSLIAHCFVYSLSALFLPLVYAYVLVIGKKFGIFFTIYWDHNQNEKFLQKIWLNVSTRPTPVS